MLVKKVAHITSAGSERLGSSTGHPGIGDRSQVDGDVCLIAQSLKNFVSSGGDLFILRLLS